MLDAWSERWSLAWVDECRAGSAAAGSGSFDAEALPGVRCLDVQRQDLEALVTRLLRADEPTVTRAVAAAAALPDPSRCAAVDVELSISDRSPPEGSEPHERLRQLRASAAEARVIDVDGAPAVGLPVVAAPDPPHPFQLTVALGSTDDRGAIDVGLLEPGAPYTFLVGGRGARRSVRGYAGTPTLVLPEAPAH